MTVTIDPQQCICCETCLATCAEGALRPGPDHQGIAVDKARCTDCWACLDVCPTGAIFRHHRRKQK